MEKINGDVRILRNRSGDYMGVAKYEQMNFYDVLQLKRNASVKLRFEDNSTFVIGPVNVLSWFMLEPKKKMGR